MRILSLILILAIIATSLCALFACEKTDNNKVPPLTTEEIALSALKSVYPEESDLSAKVAAISKYLDDTNLEKPEKTAVLTALKETGTTYANLLTKVFDKTLTSEEIIPAINLLNKISLASSADLAGNLYYTIASEIKEDLPITKIDCQKISTLLFGFDIESSAEMAENFSEGALSSVNAKELNTLLVSLSSSIYGLNGLSQGALDYFENLAKTAINGDLFAQIEPSLDDTQKQIIAGIKTYLTSIVDFVKNNYSLVIETLAAFTSNADANCFIGLTWESMNTTVYYGYTFATYEEHVLTKEEYESHAGNYDSYYSKNEVSRGYYAGDTFYPLSQSDISLANRIYLLQKLYATYDDLLEEHSDALSPFIGALMDIAKSDQGVTAILIHKDLIKEQTAPTATLSELISALAAIIEINVKDGFTAQEKTAANTAVNTFTAYLHSYLPNIF